MHHAKPISGRRRKIGYRCILFVPGDQPDLFLPAVSCGADAVCLDLEAAVAPGRKLIARTAVSEFLSSRPAGVCDLIVRMNDPESPDWRSDVSAVTKARPDFLMIPKVRTDEGVRWVADIFGAAMGLIPLIETAEGLDKVTWIGAASPAVRGLLFGGFDLALELRAEPTWDALHYPRSRVVHAAALNRIVALDMPSRAIDDPDGLWEEADRARRMGFVGKVAVHPNQVPVIQKVFTPSPDEIVWAQNVLQVTRSGEVGSIVMDGQVIDRPIIEAARQILERSEQQPAEEQPVG